MNASSTSRSGRFSRESDEVLFRRPPAEYRGTPFWSWNCRLDRAQLLRQIAILQRMGFGGFQMHARTGLSTRYLGPEYLDLIRACVREAQRRELRAWLYDEDRWPSGFAGGLVTAKPNLRAKYLLITHNPYRGLVRPTPNVSYARAGRMENGRLLARYAVRLGADGSLEGYRRVPPKVRINAPAREWLVYLETAGPTPWFNHQGYVDTLSPAALKKFVAVTHEPLKRAAGAHFGRTVPGIFTDEPQHIFKESLVSAHAQHDLVLPATTDFLASYTRRHGEDLLDHLPELVWELPNGAASPARYRYHNHVTDRFAAAFSRTLGRWCERNQLQLTGHMMEEPTLGSQTKAVGEAMRSLAHFHVPGVDMLCDREELNTLKQAQSVARQYGRPGVMSELYGATGWHFDFAGHKRQGDWQAALGVTLRVPHLAWVSMAGEAKRDYPASISYQSPWWRQYRLIEDHFARVNVIMRRGQPVVRLAVIHPIETYWLAHGPLRQTQGTRERLEQHFRDIPDWLLGGLIDFDYLSEALLPSQVKRGPASRLVVGATAYEAVLVPPVATLRSTTLAILARFRSKGGIVIFAGDAPALMDAKPSTVPVRLAARSVRCQWQREKLLDLLQPWRDLDCATSNGTRPDRVLYQLRQEGGMRHLFLCNRDRERDCGPLSLKIKGEWSCIQRDTVTGASHEAAATNSDGCTLLQVELAAHGHLLLTLNPGRSGPRTIRRPTTWRRSGVLSGPVPVVLSEPNVLLLDQAEWRWNQGPWRSREELLRINEKLRQECGLPALDGNEAQAWTETAPTRRMGRVTLRFRWSSRVMVPRPCLALEEAADWTATLNGRRVQLKPSGWWVDESINTCALPGIKPGRQELVLERDYTSRTGLEWCYLLGEFGVRLAGRHATLVAPVRSLACGSWTRQGLPFYTGNVTYRFDLTASEKTAVQFPRFGGALLNVALDGGRGRPVAFAPFRRVLGKLTRGRHRLDVTVFGHRANAFGPLHHTDAAQARFGPAAWRSKGAQWNYGYKLLAMGLLAEPHVETGHPSP